jgi:hypothetical protein
MFRNCFATGIGGLAPAHGTPLVKKSAFLRNQEKEGMLAFSEGSIFFCGLKNECRAKIERMKMLLAGEVNPQEHKPEWKKIPTISNSSLLPRNSRGYPGAIPACCKKTLNCTQIRPLARKDDAG